MMGTNVLDQNPRVILVSAFQNSGLYLWANCIRGLVNYFLPT